MNDTALVDAIYLADSIRREHNGVFGVELKLGHDGNNQCILKDYDHEVGRGESGQSGGLGLLTAIRRAVADRAKRKKEQELRDMFQGMEYGNDDAKNKFYGLMIELLTREPDAAPPATDANVAPGCESFSDPARTVPGISKVSN